MSEVASISAGLISFDDLPKPIILLIYSFLDDKSLCSVARLNKSHRELASDPFLWKRVFKSVYWNSKSWQFLTHDEAQKLSSLPGTPMELDNNSTPLAAEKSIQPTALNWRGIYIDTKDNDRLKWKLNQVFGEDPSSVNEENVITSVEFDPSGEFLSIGYQCGQIVIFRNAQASGVATGNGINASTYKFYTQFESHHPEFDFLTSLEIEEKINKIRWVRTKFPNNTRFLLSTNDKTIKLWKLREKSSKLRPSTTPVQTQQRKVYANAHAYNINSISLCSDAQLFISADDLRINLWNIDNSSEAFTIVDMKPGNMNELNEVITCAEFHPILSHQFVFSSSKGCMYMADMRQKALCDKSLMSFAEKDRSKSFFSEVTSSISDVKFTRDGRYILARDYMHLKIWDTHLNAAPVVTYDVHEHLQPKLYELYENDNIFDKFECAFSGNDMHMLTGSYSNNFMIYDISTSQTKHFQAINPRDRRKKRSSTLPTTQDINFTEKVTHVAWHPTNSLVAIAAGNYIYLYHLAP